MAVQPSNLRAWKTWRTFVAVHAIFGNSSGCASLRPDVPGVESFPLADAERTALGLVFAAQTAEHPGLSGFQIMTTSDLAFVARAAPADAAELVERFDEASSPHHVYRVEHSETSTPRALRWTAEEDGETVHHDVEPMTGFWLRPWRDVLGVSIPEHLL